MLKNNGVNESFLRIHDVFGIVKHDTKDAVEFKRRVEDIRKQIGKSMEER